MYAWFHYFVSTPVSTLVTPRDIYIFSRRSALVRPSERVPFCLQECYVHLVYQMSVWTVLSIFWCFIVVPRQLASNSRHVTRVSFRHRGVNFGYRSSRASGLLIKRENNIIIFLRRVPHAPISPPLQRCRLTGFEPLDRQPSRNSSH